MPSGLCVCELERFIKTSLKFYSAGLFSKGQGSISGSNPLQAGQPKQLCSGAFRVVAVLPVQPAAAREVPRQAVSVAGGNGRAREGDAGFFLPR